MHTGKQSSAKFFATCVRDHEHKASPPNVCITSFSGHDRAARAPIHTLHVLVAQSRHSHCGGNPWGSKMAQVSKARPLFSQTIIWIIRVRQVHESYEFWYFMPNGGTTPKQTDTDMSESRAPSAWVLLHMFRPWHSGLLSVRPCDLPIASDSAPCSQQLVET